MSEDAVKLYKKAMVSLQREKLALEKELSSARAIISITEKRLAEIDAAFSGSSSVNRRGRPARKIPKKVKSKTAKKTAIKRLKNKLSLKEVVLNVTKGKTLDAKQIFDAACKAGHKFGGKNPMNSVRVLLYTNKKLFKNKKDKFTTT
jgi:predicted RNase H-like nuclease (RuvC/YqgF family)